MQTSSGVVTYHRPGRTNQHRVAVAFPSQLRNRKEDVLAAAISANYAGRKFSNTNHGPESAHQLTVHCTGRSHPPLYITPHLYAWLLREPNPWSRPCLVDDVLALQENVAKDTEANAVVGLDATKACR